MELTDKIQRAINFSAQKHLGQKRKDRDLPYIVHPFSVAWILSSYTKNEDVIVAGLLHDILEDVKGSSRREIAEEFGEDVATIVVGVTEEKDPNIERNEKTDWLKRKQRYIDNLKIVGLGSVLVAAADKIHNLQSIANAYGEAGDSLWDRFNAPKDKKLWFYEEVIKVIRQRLADDPIVEELERSLELAKKTTGV